MNIRTDIIAEHLKNYYDILLSKTDKRVSLCSFRFYDKNELKPGILYIMGIGDFAYFNRFSPDNAYIVVGVNISSIPKNLEYLQHTDIIYIEEADNTSLSNHLSDIFDLYNSWEDEMDSCSLNMDGLQKIINCSVNILKGSIILADYRFNYVAYSADWANEINLIRRNYEGHTPDYIVSDLLTNPEYMKIQNSRELFEYPIHNHKELVDAYCYNIFKPHENEYRVRILFVPKTYPAPASSLYLLKIFAEKLEKIYNEIPDNSLPVTSYHELRSAIRSGVEKEPYSISLLNSTLHYVGWNINDTYELLTFRPYFFDDTKEINGVSQVQLELMLPYSCTILYKKDIVAVINLSKGGLSEKDINSSLFSDFIREHLYKVGASVSFSDFTHLNQAYIESIIALQQGNRIDNTLWFYNFSDYTFSYIIEHCQSEINSRDLCLPGFITLMDYDKKHKTDYVKTLCQFVECKYNVTHTAEKLFLHRTTLIKHLDKIWEISGIDINNWKQRVHLVLSIEIMKK